MSSEGFGFLRYFKPQKGHSLDGMEGKQNRGLQPMGI